MQRLTDHAELPILGYPSALSVRPGAGVGFHLSGNVPVPSLQIVRLDRHDRPTLDWPLAALAPLQVRAFDLGSWLSLPVSGDRGELDFALQLTRNLSARVLFCSRDFECRYAPCGTLSIRAPGRSLEISRVLPERIWLTLRFTWQPDSCHLRIGRGSDGLVDWHASLGVGKIDGLLIGTDWRQCEPTLNARVADVSALDRHATRRSHWPLPCQPQVEVTDQQGVRAPLRVHGAPTWAVRGPLWNGDYHDPRGAPAHYAAVHLHEDDRPAFNWPQSLAVQVPQEAASGVYGLCVTAGGVRLEIPFVVLPVRVAQRLLFLLPTLTYQAYANEALPEALYPWQNEDPGHRAAQRNQWLSLYDCHADGSGVSLATWPSPWATVREDYRYPLCGGPHGLPIDLHMLRFLAEQGIDVAVITDHDLHRQPQLLAGCAGLVTASHPEYWTAAMLDALQALLDQGSSLAYLGGNGCYWVSALDDDGTLEVRRGQRGVRTWESPPGENHLALTGEPGGLWRWRGRAEHGVLGVGTAAMGFTRAQPYQRAPASYKPAWAWLFDGIKAASIDAPGLLLAGVAGYEIDRTSTHWGTPAGTVVLATATGFDSGYALDLGELEPHEGPPCRADLCIRRTPAGGLVLAVGSVCWGGALPAKGQMNTVGRLTINGLRAMLPA